MFVRVCVARVIKRKSGGRSRQDIVCANEKERGQRDDDDKTVCVCV
jgi:hypothetical protein